MVIQPKGLLGLYSHWKLDIRISWEFLKISAVKSLAAGGEIELVIQNAVSRSISQWNLVRGSKMRFQGGLEMLYHLARRCASSSSVHCLLPCFSHTLAARVVRVNFRPRGSADFLLLAAMNCYILSLLPAVSSRFCPGTWQILCWEDAPWQPVSSRFAVFGEWVRSVQVYWALELWQRG